MSLLIEENKTLKTFNTFGIDVSSRFFIEVETEEQVVELYSMEEFQSIPKLVLGGGSNVLFTKDYEGLVIYINIKGIKHTIENTVVSVESGGGEVWNDLVQYCVSRDFGGIENLSLIPGTVGAAPVQNIGAYGVELKDVFRSCRVFDTYTNEFASFEKKDCNFSYRDSIFKSEKKDRYIILSVSLVLSLDSQLNTSYGAIHAELENQGILLPTIQDLSNVVSKIRVSKLPDPSTIGNSGSFFKNPILDARKLQTIQSSFPAIVSYPINEQFVKVAAGWLIEQCGWKGLQVGNTGTWKNQALVLVNHGGATGAEVKEFSEKIIQSVQRKFGIQLEREVNMI